LQQVGLNKYEAEAYYTLLAEGPLTGYELGKRSQVPLSRSYEVLERLTRKGLALVQPGDPPRFMAEDPDRFLGQVRLSMTRTIDSLASSLATLTTLATLAHSISEGEFWVLRGRQHIFARIRAMAAEAQRSIGLYLSPGYDAELASALALAREKGCQITRVSTTVQSPVDQDIILLLVDDHEALAGTLTPADRCQSVVSTNRALITALSHSFGQQLPVEEPPPVTSTVTTRPGDQLDWVAWEDRKLRRLWSPGTDTRVA